MVGMIGMTDPCVYQFRGSKSWWFYMMVVASRSRVKVLEVKAQNRYHTALPYFW